MIEWFKRKLFMVRSGAVERRWSVERFLPTSDLDLSETERKQLRWMHFWRQLVPLFLARFGSCGNGEQIYCFGVAHGSTVWELVSGFRNRNMAIPHMHLFDSFQGLPAEQPGVSVPSVWNSRRLHRPQIRLR